MNSIFFFLKEDNSTTKIFTCSARSSKAVKTRIRYIGSLVTALSLKSMYSRHGSSPKVSTEPISVKLFSRRFKVVREYNLSSPESEQQNSGRYVMSLWTTTDTLYYTVYTKTYSLARARKKYRRVRASVHTRERWLCRGICNAARLRQTNLESGSIG